MANKFMWNRTFAAILAVGLIWATSSVARAGDDEKEARALASSLPAAKVTLPQGLVAAQPQGQPISGKFEVEDGHLQLSVYTAQGGKFSEVLVDYNTGAVAKTEPITGGDDLTEAKSQAEAMAKAKKSLKSAVDQAEKASAGFRAVSVTPELKAGHPVAVVTLLKGTQSKSVSEPLE